MALPCSCRIGVHVTLQAVVMLGVACGLFRSARAAGPEVVDLPLGVRAVWSLESAHREATPTRERVWLNGLWRWQPAGTTELPVPDTGWGFFKVPGSWPGITDYQQKESQTVHLHPAWRDRSLGDLTAGWYEREFSVPAAWGGRRITLHLDTLNSHAVVYLDGERVGEARFPAGELEITRWCRPGATHRLSLRVTALPLQAVLRSYTDSAASREVAGSVARRGLCGDVFLSAVPAGSRIDHLSIGTSVRRGELSVAAVLRDLAPGTRYRLEARVSEPGGEARTFRSQAFRGREVAEDGRWAFTNRWKPRHLWDLHTPGNRAGMELSLVEEGGTLRDVFWREDFGFREFWIDGRDFHLNGSRVFLSAVPLDNAQVSAAAATHAAARESFARLRSFGINLVYTHNYGCEPGSHLALGEILRAADDTGMLVALSQPHFSHYAWQGPESDRDNGYAAHAAHYARVAGNHPSVVMYAMSHNATGYNEDMNPDLIDGRQDVRDSWALRNVALARRAEAIVAGLDPGRIIYHHASGNLGPMHPVNFYPNWVPIQELSDWFGHWATAGVKPVFLCEYGAPFTWDWTMYRGWYGGKREFGSARVPWEFCLAEWNAQFLGDRAYPASENEKANLRWEARQFREGRVWHRWDYPVNVGSPRLEERYPVFAAYLTDNWRAFRTWGVSATSPWEHEHFWRLRDGVDRGRRALLVEWDRLQRPGFSPDYLDRQYERMDLAYDRSDWIATPAAQALVRNNGPLLAYLGGQAGAFTSKDHNFLPGERVGKQVILLNNSREPVAYEARWTVDLPRGVSGRRRGRLPTGEQVRIPVEFRLPSDLPPGRRRVRLQVEFGTGEVQEDELPLDILAPAGRRGGLPGRRIGVLDPQGATTAWLERWGVPAVPVEPERMPADLDLLIVGKGALTAAGPGPDLARVREGLRVLVFEQTAEVLERRLGFRVAEYGLRQVFPRVPGHPVLAGLGADHLRDWRGEATLLPPRLKYETGRAFNGAPTVEWCGIPVTRAWRCGNRGNVASVLIEKPARGDFLPLVDGGYALQYSPLMEFREGRGAVWFCQLDVTGRTEVEPAADRLAIQLLAHALAWVPPQGRRVGYAGDPAGQEHLRAIGVQASMVKGGGLGGIDVLVAGPGGVKASGWGREELARWMEGGGRLVGLGLEPADFAGLPGEPVTVGMQEHLSTGWEAGSASPTFAGIAPADVHLRDPRQVALVVGGASRLGNGVLAESGGAVFCQVTPWAFAGGNAMNLKRTHRRVSVAVTRLLANLHVSAKTPLLERFSRPVEPARPEDRWLEGLYLDWPEEWDDPYRFFRW